MSEEGLPVHQKDFLILGLKALPFLLFIIFFGVVFVQGLTSPKPVGVPKVAEAPGFVVPVFIQKRNQEIRGALSGDEVFQAGECNKPRILLNQAYLSVILENQQRILSNQDIILKKLETLK